MFGDDWDVNFLAHLAGDEPDEPDECNMEALCQNFRVLETL